MTTVGAGEAFTSGVVSIYTPCAGVIVPAFVAFVVGLGSMSGWQRNGVDRHVALGVGCFVIGFGLVFVLLGSALGSGAEWVQGNQRNIARVGGVVIIGLGIVATGLLPLPGPGDRGWRVSQGGRLLVSGLVGGAIAIGWTPCVNEGLGKVLTLAVNPDSAWRGAGLLGVYSGGLMTPFLGAGMLGALGLPRVQSPPVRRGVMWVTAAALMLLGALVLTDRFVELTGYLFRLTA